MKMIWGFFRTIILIIPFLGLIYVVTTPSDWPNAQQNLGAIIIIWLGLLTQSFRHKWKWFSVHLVIFIIILIVSESARSAA